MATLAAGTYAVAGGSASVRTLIDVVTHRTQLARDRVTTVWAHHQHALSLRGELREHLDESELGGHDSLADGRLRRAAQCTRR